MDDCTKLMATVILACLLATDIGWHAVSYFNLPISPTVGHQQYERQTSSDNEKKKSEILSSGNHDGKTTLSDFDDHSEKQIHSDIWVVLQGAAAPLLVVFSIALTCVGFKQAEISRQQMIIAHRPRLRIQNAILRPNATHAEGKPGEPPEERFPFIYGEPITSTFRIVNTGGSDAEIIECCAFILAIEEPYDLDPEIGIFVNISHPKVIKAGDSAFAIFDKSEGLSENAVITLQMQNSQQESDVRSTLKTVNTYLKGFVKYKDGNNTIRRTDFSRKYDILQRRFTYWTTDPDYESES